MSVEVVKAWFGTHYCGRSTSYKPSYGVDCSALGNPFPMSAKADGSRDAVCDKYENYFNAKVMNKDPNVLNTLAVILEDMKKGKDIKLGCFCAPLRCHCSTIKHFLDLTAKSD